jgi:hypothetical protein
MAVNSTYEFDGRTNEITLPQFGQTSSLYAAEVVDSEGNVYAWVKEPQERSDSLGQFGAAWDDAEFRTAVYDVVKEYFGPESEAPQDETFTLVFDPQRDNADELVIER